MRSDTATYNRQLWAEDFVHQNSSNGILYPKREIGVMFGQPRFDKIEYFYPENVIIQFITNDAAMVFARPPFRGVNQSAESYTQYNDIYIRRNGKWICVSANVTSVAKPGDALPAFSKLPEPTKLLSWHAGTTNDKNELERLNTTHAEAFAQSKPEILKEILAEDYMLLAATGILYKKRDVLQQLQNNASTIAHYRIENLNIRFVAVDIAMIHAVFVSTFRDGKTSAIQYNDIYVKREGKWVCVSGNNTYIRN